MGATVLVGLWAWHTNETKLRCAESSGICKPYPSIVSFIVSDITAFIQTEGSTRLVILIKNIYTLCGRKRFLLKTIKFFLI